jgi:hypothetical protein
VALQYAFITLFVDVQQALYFLAMLAMLVSTTITSPGYGVAFVRYKSSLVEGFEDTFRVRPHAALVPCDRGSSPLTRVSLLRVVVVCACVLAHRCTIGMTGGVGLTRTFCG